MVSRLSIDIPGCRGLLIELVPLWKNHRGCDLYQKSQVDLSVKLQKYVPFQGLGYILSYQIMKAVS